MIRAALLPRAALLWHQARSAATTVASIAGPAPGRLPRPAAGTWSAAAAAAAHAGADDAPLTTQLAQAGSCFQLAGLLASATQAGQLDAALLAAARLGCSDELSSLLAVGARPGCVDAGSGLAPLHLAAAAGSEECVRMLLVAGAPADQRDKLQRTPAMLCVLRGHGSTSIPRQLVAAGGSLESCCQFGHTPLILAGAVGDASAVRQLLELGSDPFKTDSNGYTPRAAAARRSAREVSARCPPAPCAVQGERPAGSGN